MRCADGQKSGGTWVAPPGHQVCGRNASIAYRLSPWVQVVPDEFGNSALAMCIGLDDIDV